MPTPTLVVLVGLGDCRVEEGAGGILDDDADEEKPDELKEEAALKADEVDDVDGRSFVGLKDEDEASDALLARYPMVVNGDCGPCKVKLDVPFSQLHGAQQYVLSSHETIAVPSRKALDETSLRRRHVLGTRKKGKNLSTFAWE